MIIDLCSGLGKWSEEAIAIDIDRKVRPTIIADVRYLPLRRALKPKHVHASPPCKYFSIARARHFGYDEKGIADSLRIVAACFDAIDYLEPQTWTIENPQGLLNRILPSDIKTNYKAYDYPHKPTSFWSNNKSLKRALIPQDIRNKLISGGNPSLRDVRSN